MRKVILGLAKLIKEVIIWLCALVIAVAILVACVFIVIPVCGLGALLGEE